MAVPIALASSVLAVVLVVVLAREIRLRRALESLLRRLIAYWRTREERTHRDTGHPADAADHRLHK
jgi:ABC-type phosphate/phosphonate transport system permease subunit